MTKEFKTAKIFPISVRNFKLDTLTEDKIKEIIDIIEGKCDWDRWSNGEIRGSWTIQQQLLDIPELHDVRDEILECFKTFKEEEGHKCDGLKVVCSWGNKLEKGEHILPHAHANAYLAAAVHLNPGSNLVFQHPTTLDRTGLDFDDRDNLQALEFPIEPGHIVIFPSKLVHAVKTHEFDIPRYSLGANCMPAFYGRPTGYVDFR